LARNHGSCLAVKGRGLTTDSAHRQKTAAPPPMEERNMKRVAKKLLAAALAAVLAVSVLAGCGTSVKPEDYDTTVVATYGDENIYLDEVNMYLRAEQYYYEYIYTYMYGMSDIWNQEVANGVTMKDSVLESVMSMIRQIYVLKDQADSLGVSLSEEDMAKIEKTVDGVLKDSADELVKAYNLSRERMIEIYKNNAIANLVWEALVADVDTNIPEEEVRCVGASYVLVNEPNLKAEPKEGEEVDARPAKAKAQEIYDAVKGGATLADAAKELNLTVSKGTYFVGDKYEEKTLGYKAVGMKEGEAVIFELEEGKGWYVMVLDTLKDEAATESKRESVLSQRKAELFKTKYAEVEKNSAAFAVDEKVWQNVPMDTLFVAPEPQTTAAAK